MRPKRLWRKHDPWLQNYPDKLPDISNGLYTLLDYCPSGDFQEYPGNQLVKNLKYRPDIDRETNKQQTYYRNRAIEQTIMALLDAPFVSEESVIVPVPGSKAVGDPEYNPLWDSVATILDFEHGLNMYSAIRRKTSIVSFHHRKGEPRSVEKAAEGLEYVGFPEYIDATNRDLIIFDDVITSGSSMAAVLKMITDNQQVNSVTFLSLTITVKSD